MLTPPAIKTLPLFSSVAVKYDLGVLKLPTIVKV